MSPASLHASGPSQTRAASRQTRLSSDCCACSVPAWFGEPTGNSPANMGHRYQSGLVCALPALAPCHPENSGTIEAIGRRPLSRARRSSGIPSGAWHSIAASFRSNWSALGCPQSHAFGSLAESARQSSDGPRIHRTLISQTASRWSRPFAPFRKRSGKDICGRAFPALSIVRVPCGRYTVGDT